VKDILQNKEDKELIELIQKNGDLEAFHELYRRYESKVNANVAKFGFICRLSESEIDDIIQNAWLKAWNNIKNFDTSLSAIGTFLYRIARNATYDYLEKKGNDPVKLFEHHKDKEKTPEEQEESNQLQQEDVSLYPDASEITEAKETAEILVNSMAESLTERQYDCYHRKLLGWKSSEIALELLTTPDNVDVHITHAKKRISETVNKRHGFSKNEWENDVRKAQEFCPDHLLELLKARNPRKEGL
jgi:RNA polymerase sigma factor (sigma-70 family)